MANSKPKHHASKQKSRRHADASPSKKRAVDDMDYSASESDEEESGKQRKESGKQRKRREKKEHKKQEEIVEAALKASKGATAGRKRSSTIADSLDAVTESVEDEMVTDAPTSNAPTPKQATAKPSQTTSGQAKRKAPVSPQQQTNPDPKRSKKSKQPYLEEYDPKQGLAGSFDPKEGPSGLAEPDLSEEKKTRFRHLIRAVYHRHQKRAARLGFGMIMATQEALVYAALMAEKPYMFESLETDEDWIALAQEIRRYEFPALISRQTRHGKKVWVLLHWPPTPPDGSDSSSSGESSSSSDDSDSSASSSDSDSDSDDSDSDGSGSSGSNTRPGSNASSNSSDRGGNRTSDIDDGTDGGEDEEMQDEEMQDEDTQDEDAQDEDMQDEEMQDVDDRSANSRLGDGGGADSEDDSIDDSWWRPGPGVRKSTITNILMDATARKEREEYVAAACEEVHGLTNDNVNEEAWRKAVLDKGFLTKKMEKKERRWLDSTSRALGCGRIRNKNTHNPLIFSMHTLSKCWFFMQKGFKGVPGANVMADLYSKEEDSHDADGNYLPGKKAYAHNHTLPLFLEAMARMIRLEKPDIIVCFGWHVKDWFCREFGTPKKNGGAIDIGGGHLTEVFFLDHPSYIGGKNITVERLEEARDLFRKLEKAGGPQFDEKGFEEILRHRRTGKCELHRWNKKTRDAIDSKHSILSDIDFEMPSSEALQDAKHCLQDAEKDALRDATDDDAKDGHQQFVERLSTLASEAVVSKLREEFIKRRDAPVTERKYRRELQGAWNPKKKHGRKHMTWVDEQLARVHNPTSDEDRKLCEDLLASISAWKPILTSKRLESARASLDLLRQRGDELMQHPEPPLSIEQPGIAQFECVSIGCSHIADSEEGLHDHFEKVHRGSPFNMKEEYQLSQRPMNAYPLVCPEKGCGWSFKTQLDANHHILRNHSRLAEILLKLAKSSSADSDKAALKYINHAQCTSRPDPPAGSKRGIHANQSRHWSAEDIQSLLDAVKDVRGHSCWEEVCNALTARLGRSLHSIRRMSNKLSILHTLLKARDEGRNPDGVSLPKGHGSASELLEFASKMDITLSSLTPLMEAQARNGRAKPSTSTTSRTRRANQIAFKKQPSKGSSKASSAFKKAVLPKGSSTASPSFMKAVLPKGKK